MKFSIITRCTRVGNIEKVKESVFSNLKPKTKVHWHVMFDTKVLKDISADVLNKLDDENTTIHFRKGDEWGLGQLNKIIKKCDGWVYHCDDDNIIHKDFYASIEKHHRKNKESKVFVVSQHVGGKDFSGLEVREALAENVAVGKIDLAQWLIHSSIHEDFEYGSGYIADGEFIVNLFEKAPEAFTFIPDVLSYYNFLEKESTPKLPRVLYIGEGEPVLKTTKYLKYEDDSLTVKYIKDDRDIRKVIAEFKPDSIITRGDSFKAFPNLANLPIQFRRKWLNIDNEGDMKRVGDIAYRVSENAMLDPNNLDDQDMISFTTPIYNTGEKLWNTYASVARQEYGNWEWILMNDSTDGGKTLKIAEEIAANDPRVRVYDFREKSGGIIGEVKWRANVMAKGYILAELDHDDLLVESCAGDLHKAAQKHPECGFFYGDTAEVTESWENKKYPPGFALGYGNYRDEEYKGRMLSPANQQNINPKTIRHIVGVPNHIRAWRRSTYFEIGGHNRSLSVVDDYELIIRTFLKTKMCKIPKLSYIQFLYSEAGHRNTHDLSRADIQRRVRTIASHYNEQIKERFEELGQHDWAYEEAPHYPIRAKSRYGEEEGIVNVIYKEEK